MYEYLKDEGVPSIIREAVPLLGTREQPGTRDNPLILSWARELEVDFEAYAKQYTHDSIPWCGLFVGLVCKRANWVEQMPSTFLWAQSWATFGQSAKQPSLGDVMVFVRKGGGHVAIYVGEDNTHWHILGGNQSDQVNISRRPKAQGLWACRRPKWRVSQPQSVRPVYLRASGQISSSEQ
jgi:uncharacterized protein (TIGR02594 family)